MCGKVTKAKKVFEKRDPTTCRHANTSKLGSKKATMKIFCKHCGHVIDEMPQEEARKRRQAAQELESATSASLDLVSNISRNVTDEVRLDAMQTMTLVEEFKLQVEDFIVSQNVEGVSEPSVTAKDLHEILNDLLEECLVSQETASTARSTPGELSSGYGPASAAPSRAADLGSSDRGTSRGQDYTAFMAASPEPLASKIPLTLEEDVFGVLDDGANSSVCGRRWCDNAAEKLKKLGFEFPWLNEDGVSFKGLGGSTKTLGDRRMIFCIECENPNSDKECKQAPLPGMLDCHVTSGDDTPLLLHCSPKHPRTIEEHEGFHLPGSAQRWGNVEVTFVSDEGKQPLGSESDQWISRLNSDSSSS